MGKKLNQGITLKKINKLEFVELLANACDLNFGFTKLLAHSVSEKIATDISNGHTIELRGFGCFSATNIPGGKVTPHFKASKSTTIY